MTVLFVIVLFVIIFCLLIRSVSGIYNVDFVIRCVVLHMARFCYEYRVVVAQS